VSRAESAVRTVAVVEAAPVPNPSSPQRLLPSILAGLGYDITVVTRAGTHAPRPVAGAQAAPRLLNVPELRSDVSPRFAAVSYEIYQALRGTSFDAIIFEELGGHAYCTARARQLELDFERTTVVIACSGGVLYAAARDQRAYLPRGEFATGVLERLALELADVAVFDDPSELEWARTLGWGLPPDCREGAQGTADCDVWADVLATEAGRKHSVPGSLPDVSVVVPRHERTTYLPHCLDALAAQSQLPAEVIVADDGSTSATALRQLDELESRSWPWQLRCLRLPHGGVGPARNAGYDAATADLILFVDDDDVLFPDALETLVRAHHAAGADVVAAGARRFYGEGAPTPRDDDTVVLFFGQPYELGLLSNYCGPPTCLWRREALERIGGFRPVLSPNEDWEILVRAALAGAQLVALPDAAYWYRRTPGSRFGADAYAKREMSVAVVAEAFAETLPASSHWLPLLAAGAYEELERRRVAAKPWTATARRRARLLAQRTRQVREEEGLLAVARRAGNLLVRRQ